MKTTVSAAVGGYNFIFDTDAFERLSAYLEKFRNALEPASESEVMDELEMRIADLFHERLSGKMVVDLRIVESVISQLGLPGGEQYHEDTHASPRQGTSAFEDMLRGRRRIFRDVDDSKLGGVCSGLAIYFDIDVVFMRLLFLLALILGTAGFWIYLILWIIVPPAKSATEKCELHGLEADAENIRRFTTRSNK